MTKEFDPTRPCRYRNGGKPLAVFVLPEPQAGGETIVSVRKESLAHTHFANGRLNKDLERPEDLINIPEEVEVEMWGVVPNGRDKARAVFASENVAEHYRQPSEVVVRMTGSYTR